MRPALQLAQARIRHRRYAPRAHAFSYDMGYLLLDVDQLDAVCARSPLWSRNRFNLISLHDADLLQPAAPAPAGHSPVRMALAAALREQLGRALGDTDQVLVLTLPRFLGYAFNPVSFYWVYPTGSREPACIAAEITNTPWDERHLYCFACDGGTTYRPVRGAATHRFVFDKRFHVSPFMPMDLDYDWRFKLDRDDGGASAIHMQLKRAGALVFDATMSFRLREMPAREQHLYPLRHPLQSLKIVAAIYWQALRLWLKRIPLFTHPAKAVTAGPTS